MEFRIVKWNTLFYWKFSISMFKRFIQSLKNNLTKCSFCIFHVIVLMFCKWIWPYYIKAIFFILYFRSKVDIHYLINNKNLNIQGDAFKCSWTNCTTQKFSTEIRLHCVKCIALKKMLEVHSILLREVVFNINYIQKSWRLFSDI